MVTGRRTERIARTLARMVAAGAVTLVVLVGSLDTTPAALKTFSKTSTVAQDVQIDAAADGFQITDPAGPFTFQKVNTIRKLTKITITVTLLGGDTGPGDFDENDLTLALDGIDTGIALNGFRRGETERQTISGVPRNEAAIRAALKADGQLAASIRDADPEDGSMSSRSTDTATLEIQGKQKPKGKKKSKQKNR